MRLRLPPLPGHPSGTRLAAWFDEQGEAEVGLHVMDCARCLARTQRLQAVRATLRGEPVHLPAPCFPRHRLGFSRHRLARPLGRAVLAPAALVAIVLLGVLGAVRLGAPGREAAQGVDRRDVEAPVVDLVPGPRGEADRPVGEAAGGSPAAPATRTPTDPARPTAHPEPAPSAGPPAAVGRPVGGTAGGPEVGPPARGPLRLGVVRPRSGFEAHEADQMERAVRWVAERATAAGGIQGRAVEVTVVPADDEARLSTLASDVDVLVGGFGAAPPGPAWLLPAELSAAGPSVVLGELSPLEVGSRLASDLRAREMFGPVGVVVAAGPEAGLADGLEQVAPVVRVSARPDSACARETSTLRQRRVVALAVAGPPELVARCAGTLARLGWQPPGGLLVPPSAAYAHLHLMPSLHGARTVLGFPWPTSEGPGAARFRSSVPGARSYRALVSFAAAELALAVARADGEVSPLRVRAGRFASDLLDLDRGVNRSAAVVSASLGGWREETPG